MEGTTREEREEIAWRILNAKADCSLRLIERVVDLIRDLDPSTPTMQEMARSVVSGQANEPGAMHALAHLAYDYADALRQQKIAYRMMRDDWAADQRRSSQEEAGMKPSA